MLTHHYISSIMEHPPTIVLLHGYGADEHDLLTVAQMISDEYQIISLRAPIALPWGGYAWYQLYQTPIGFRCDDKSRHQSYLMLSETIIELDSQYAIASKPFIVLGFSQGAVMSYSLSLDRSLQERNLLPTKVVILSGYMPDDIRTSFSQNEDISTSYFVAHGKMDELIKIEEYWKSINVLQNAKVKLTNKEYACGHTITQECIHDIRQWLEYEQ